MIPSADCERRSFPSSSIGAAAIAEVVNNGGQLYVSASVQHVIGEHINAVPDSETSVRMVSGCTVFLWNAILMTRRAVPPDDTSRLELKKRPRPPMKQLGPDLKRLHLEVEFSI